jgi:hypothetical protein
MSIAMTEVMTVEARVGAGRDPLRRGEEVGLVVHEGGDGLHDEEEADQADKGDDEEAGGLGGAAEEAIPPAAGARPVTLVGAVTVRVGKVVDR